MILISSIDKTKGRLFQCFLFFCVLVFKAELYAKAQFSTRYEPSFAISSGLNFSGNLAEESAVWIRNSVRFTSEEVFPGYICLNLGYSHRSYLVEYNSTTLGYIKEQKYRNSFVIQGGAEMRFRNIRKLRKSIQPHLGIYFQYYLTKIRIDEDVDFIDNADYDFGQVVFEIGSEFVFDRWPRMYFSIQIEPHLSETRIWMIDNSGNISYDHKEPACHRMVLGIRF